MLVHHEALARGVEEIGTLPAHCFRHEWLLAACARPEPQDRRVELHELHVRDFCSGTQRQCYAVTGRHRRIRRLREDLAEASGGEHHRGCERRAHSVALPLAHDVEGDALSATVGVLEQIEHQGTFDQLDARV